jgi:ribosomal protein S18 acetylase RimI-like enzyme
MATSMPGLSLSLETSPRLDDVRTVAEGLDRSVQLQMGDGVVQRFSVFLRDRARAVIGGVNGRLAFGNLHVDQLWCDENIRRRGFGSELLARAEAHAHAHGAVASLLNTVDHDLVHFYAKRGYHVIGEIEGLLGGRSVCFMRKFLRGNGAG